MSIEEERHKAMKKAMFFLNRRPHTRYELKTKLYAREFRTPVIEFTLDELERLHLIDDAFFAEGYLFELQQKGQGSFRIRQAMSKRGIAKDIIDSLLESIAPEDEYDIATRVLERKMNSLCREKDKRKRYQKGYRFLASRGFTSDTIRNVLDEVMTKEEE